MILARSLFWRIYATLLASLILSAALVGLLWNAVGEGPPEQMHRLPARLLEAALPPPAAGPGDINAAAGRLAEAIEGDVTVLDASGRKLAVAGHDLSQIRIVEDRPWDGRRGEHVWAFNLSNGRRVLARFGVGFRRPVWHLLGALAAAAMAVGLAALPVVARLTKRLEALRHSVEQWGNGDLGARAALRGKDEIAAVAASFNTAAERVQALLDAHRALLANASHELRSPLARLSMAAGMMQDAPSPARQQEIERNLGELNQLIDEILLASRLDHAGPGAPRERVDVLALAAEEAARTDAAVDGDLAEIDADPRLLRRLIRNLLENAAKHGAPPVELTVARLDGSVRITVADRGPGLPQAERERIFEPFYRPAGRAEAGGGWGLGLSLVRQIAERHGGSVRCTGRDGGGTAFVVDLPGA